MLSVSKLYRYPVKSLGGAAVERLEIGHLGPVLDRQWVIVDENGVFLAQRASRGLGVGIPQLCLLRTEVTDSALLVHAPDDDAREPLRVPLGGTEGPTVGVRIWADVADGVDQGAAAGAWLGAVLGRWRPGHYRLVRMPDRGTRRTVDDSAALSYADGYPLLVASEASLEDLNSRIAAVARRAGEDSPAPLGWDRFRPNLVVAGAEAYAEDEWGAIDVDGFSLHGRTLCRRCPIPTTEQSTGERGREPLRTLASYRRHPGHTVGGVVFARNFVHSGTGRLQVGDTVRVRTGTPVAGDRD